MWTVAGLLRSRPILIYDSSINHYRAVTEDSVSPKATGMSMVLYNWTQDQSLGQMLTVWISEGCDMIKSKRYLIIKSEISLPFKCNQLC